MDCCICNKKNLGMLDRAPLGDSPDLYVCRTCQSIINDAKFGAKAPYNRYLKLKATVNNEWVLSILDSIITPQEDNEGVEEVTRQALELKQQTRKNMIITTGYDFENYRIIKYNGVISGECVLGTGFLSEFHASFADMFGTVSASFSEKLRNAKAAALRSLVEDCLAKHGNAIIGVDFDYITFENNMIGVVANGTAVKVEAIETPQEPQEIV